MQGLRYYCYVATRGAELVRVGTTKGFFAKASFSNHRSNSYEVVKNHCWRMVADDLLNRGLLI